MLRLLDFVAVAVLVTAIANCGIIVSWAFAAQRKKGGQYDHD